MSDWQAIKYRVIGAGVIVVSLGLAWWLLLDHEVHRLQGDNTDFPQPFEVEKFDIEEPSIPEDMNNEGGIIERAPEPNVETVQPDPVVQEPAVVEEPVVVKEPEVIAEPVVVKEPEVVKPSEVVKEPVVRDTSRVTVAPSGLPEAWVLQVASFQEKTYAEELKKKLVAGKFPAYVKVFTLPAGKTYKVLVGPKLEKSRAAQMAKDIEKEHKLKSMIMQYRPGFEE